jgi:hypothetical protein
MSLGKAYYLTCDGPHYADTDKERCCFVSHASADLADVAARARREARARGWQRVAINRGYTELKADLCPPCASEHAGLAARTGDGS